jgi:cysteine desulfurase
VSRREIYADHAGTTRAAPEVVRAMTPFLSERFGNPSSVHSRGEAARAAVDQARRQVAALIRANAEELVFTAGGSEANNLALKGVMLGSRGDRRRLVISAIEHPSVIETARHLEARGFPLTVVPVESNGVLDPARLQAALGPDVALVSVMWVNNEIGTIQPIAELARLAHAAGARFHSDAVQAAGKLELDVTAVDVDLLSLAAHKFHGPAGAGALWVRRGFKLVPLIHGGHQERGRRAGTENLPALVGMGAAAERAALQLAAREPARVAALGDALLAGLLRALPGTSLNGDPERRVRSIVNVRLPGVDGEAALHELDAAGILVSTGSACSAASPGPSHVLLALGATPEAAHASVRFSLGEDNREADVDTILDVMPRVIERLRSLAGDGAAQQR